MPLARRLAGRSLVAHDARRDGPRRRRQPVRLHGDLARARVRTLYRSTSSGRATDTRTICSRSSPRAACASPRCPCAPVYADELSGVPCRGTPRRARRSRAALRRDPRAVTQLERPLDELVRAAERVIEVEAASSSLGVSCAVTSASAPRSVAERALAAPRAHRVALHEHVRALAAACPASTSASSTASLKIELRRARRGSASAFSA